MQGLWLGRVSKGLNQGKFGVRVTIRVRQCSA